MLNVQEVRRLHQQKIFQLIFLNFHIQSCLHSANSTALNIYQTGSLWTYFCVPGTSPLWSGTSFFLFSRLCVCSLGFERGYCSKDTSQLKSQTGRRQTWMKSHLTADFLHWKAVLIMNIRISGRHSCITESSLKFTQIANCNFKNYTLFLKFTCYFKTGVGWTVKLLHQKNTALTSSVKPYLFFYRIEREKMDFWGCKVWLWVRKQSLNYSSLLTKTSAACIARKYWFLYTKLGESSPLK